MWTKRSFFLTTYPPHLVHVVFERPLMSKNELNKTQPNLTFPKSIYFFILEINPTLPNPIWPGQTQSNFWFWDQVSTWPKNQYRGFTAYANLMTAIFQKNPYICLMRIYALCFEMFYFICAFFFYFCPIWPMRIFSRTKSRIRQEPSVYELFD